MNARSIIGLTGRKRINGRPLRASVLTAFTLAFALSMPGEAVAAHVYGRSSSGLSNCSTTKNVTVKIVGSKKETTNFYFLIAFINNGDASCFLSGFPSAQPVVGVTPTAPNSHRENFSGVSAARVLLSPQRGRAYAEYRIESTSDFSRKRCRPIISDGAAFTIGQRRLIAPIKRIGATSVCSVVVSTWIGPFSHLPYS